MNKKTLSFKQVKRQFDAQNKELHEIYTLNLFDMMALLQERGVIKSTDKPSAVCSWEVM